MADSIDSIDNNILENRILKIVEKITKNRNRSCHRNIYTFLIRGNFTIEDSELKLFIDALLERGVLINVGTAEKESFRLGIPSTKDDSLPSVDENKNDDTFINTSENMSATDENISTNENLSLNIFINYKFYEILK